jgi:hypothetical protein
MEAQTFLDFGTSICSIDKKLVQQYKLALMEKNTLISIEAIDGWSFSSKLITHETKALNITIGLHNPQVHWHTRNLHFERS